MLYCFLVLHYKQTSVTIRCVESILKFNEIKVIIYDNGSNDNSDEYLRALYRNDNRVDVISSKSNDGFSRGNNKGYDYIKSKYYFDYLIVTNNDIVFTQSDFLDELKIIGSKFDHLVIGPDIRGFGNNSVHQSPLMNRIRERDEIKKDLFRYKLISKFTFLYLAYSKILNKKNKKSRRKTIEYNTIQEGVCLSGSCLIFKKEYFNFYNTLFSPETFFYHEEEIMSHKLKKDGHNQLYHPDLFVYHDHSISTNSIFKNKIKKAKFRYKNNIQSLSILIDYIENEEEIMRLK